MFSIGTTYFAKLDSKLKIMAQLFSEKPVLANVSSHPSYQGGQLLMASDRFERSGCFTKIWSCRDPGISRLSRVFSVHWDLLMHTCNRGAAGEHDTSDEQKVATVWLDLLLCLTFSLANEWLGDTNRPWKAPTKMHCIIFRHQYVHT